jgi:Na+/H+ antiporter NhaA
MIVPVLLYLLVTPDGDAARGWGIVIGTDTAFLLGVLALVGPATSTQLGSSCSPSPLSTTSPP